VSVIAGTTNEESNETNLGILVIQTQIAQSTVCIPSKHSITSAELSLAFLPSSSTYKTSQTSPSSLYRTTKPCTSTNFRQHNRSELQSLLLTCSLKNRTKSAARQMRNYAPHTRPLHIALRKEPQSAQRNQHASREKQKDQPQTLHHGRASKRPESAQLTDQEPFFALLRADSVLPAQFKQRVSGSNMVRIPFFSFCSTQFLCFVFLGKSESTVRVGTVLSIGS